MRIPSNVGESILMTQYREDIADIAKKTKDPSLMCEVGSPIAYPTTFLPIDYMNGEQVIETEIERDIEYTFSSYGICKGSINMIIGNPGTAKSTWCIQSLCSMMLPFIKMGKSTYVNYFDLEGGMSKSRIRNITGFNSRLIENLISLKDHCTTEQFYQIVKTSADKKIELAEAYPDKLKYFTGIIDANGKPVYELVPTFFVVDSLPMLVSKDIDEGDISGNMNGARTAKLNTAVIKSLTNYLKKSNIIIFIINHIHPKIQTNPFAKTQAQINYLNQDESLPGGNTVLYLCNAIFKIRTVGSKDPDYNGIQGFNAVFKMIKNRKNRAGLEAPMVYDQRYGYNRLLSTFEMLIAEGFVHTGNYSYFDGLETKKFRRKNILEELENDYKLREYFKASTVLCGNHIIDNAYKNSVQLSTEGDLDNYMTGELSDDDNLIL